jgi:hypothetical protein
MKALTDEESHMSAFRTVIRKLLLLAGISGMAGGAAGALHSGAVEESRAALEARVAIVRSELLHKPDGSATESDAAGASEIAQWFNWPNWANWNNWNNWKNWNNWVNWLNR